MIPLSDTGSVSGIVIRYWDSTNRTALKSSPTASTGRAMITNIVSDSVNVEIFIRVFSRLLLLTGVILLTACHKGKMIASSQEHRLLADGKKFVADAAFRRRALEDSFTNRDNGYAKIRLANYTRDGWDRLDVLNPRFRPIRPADIGQGKPTPDNTWQRFDDAETPWDLAHLRALGARGFAAYPAQVEYSMFEVLKDEDRVRRAGLWQTEDSLGGLVWVELKGGVFPALTCSTCHSTVDKNGTLVHGMPNHEINLGLSIDEYGRHITPSGAWGKGRIDITSDGNFDPIAIPDLRAVRFQKRLHRTGNLKSTPLSLAVRLDTGLTLSFRKSMRPPRALVYAMSTYIFGLADSLPAPKRGRGRAVFEKACASCHQGEGLSGDGMPIEESGANRAIMMNPSRTTGSVRIPSLRGGPGRRLLTADGRISSIEELLDPARTSSAHRFGLSMNKADRAALVDYLRSL